MKIENVLDCMEYISPEFIEEAESFIPAKKVKKWVKWGAVAACLCICVFGAVKLYDIPQDINGAADTGCAPAEVYESIEAAAAAAEPYAYADQETDTAAEEGAYDTATGTSKDMDAGAPATEHPAMIGSFDSSLNTGDMAVSNGCCELSNSLAAALDEYGDTVRYRVVVEVFRDGMVIDSGGDEVAAEEKRLADEGYTTAHEAVYQDNVKVFDYFTIHAEESQLRSFPVNSAYGYYISLYNEYLELAGEQTEQ